MHIQTYAESCSNIDSDSAIPPLGDMVLLFFRLHFKEQGLGESTTVKKLGGFSSRSEFLRLPRYLVAR